MNDNTPGVVHTLMRVTEQSPGGPPRRLSSIYTFTMKYVFPAIWSGGFAAFTIGAFLDPRDFHGNNGAPLPAGARWIFVAVTIVGSMLLWWACGRLKRVRMDDHSLYISNYLTEIAVPLAAVSEVKDEWYQRGQPVTLSFRDPTAFGDKITFLPRLRWTGFWPTHPAAKEIREAIARLEPVRDASHGAP